MCDHKTWMKCLLLSNFTALLLLCLYFIVHKLIIIHIFKKFISKTKEKGDQRKNSGSNVIFGGAYLSLPDYNASLVPPFVLFPFQKTLIFSLFSKHNFSKKY